MKTEQPSDTILPVVRSSTVKFSGEYFFDNDLMGTLITPGMEIMTYAETGPSCFLLNLKVDQVTWNILYRWKLLKCYGKCHFSTPPDFISCLDLDFFLSYDYLAITAVILSDFRDSSVSIISCHRAMIV